MTLVVLHLVAVAALSGTVWLVQLALYPAFATVGPTDHWDAHHRQHSRALTLVVTVPWTVQGATLALLLLDDPTPLVLLAAALGLGTVVVTAAWSLPCHARLADHYDEAVLRSLLRSNLLRALLWTAATGCAVAMVLERAS